MFFRVEGVRSVFSYPWEPGTQRIELALVGDADCDFAIESQDATLMLQLTAGLLGELACPEAGDVDRDARRNVVDVLLVLQFLAEVVNVLG